MNSSRIHQIHASRSRRDLKTSSHLKLRGPPTQPSNGLPSDGILTLTPPPQYSPPLTPPSLASTKDSPPQPSSPFTRTSSERPREGRRRRGSWGGGEGCVLLGLWRINKTINSCQSWATTNHRTGQQLLLLVQWISRREATLYVRPYGRPLHQLGNLEQPTIRF